MNVVNGGKHMNLQLDKPLFTKSYKSPRNYDSHTNSITPASDLSLLSRTKLQTEGIVIDIARKPSEFLF